jgi:hypothetical protein
MNRHRAAAAALLAAAALTSCSNNPAPNPPAATTTTTTAAIRPTHRILYTVFGLPTTVTYTGDGGIKLTTTNPTPPIIEHATLHEGDTAEITATGDNPNTGLGCSISIDNVQVAKETSYNATAGVTCTATAH